MDLLGHARSVGEENDVDVMIGRQPILDRAKRTVAYELLFRSSHVNHFDGSDGTAATNAVIRNTFMDIGRRRVLNGKRGFINVTRKVLLAEGALMLPKDQVVIEILEDIPPDPQVVEACRKLKGAGYQLALDDVTSAEQNAPLVPYAQYAKIDMMGLERSQFGGVCRHLRSQGLTLLAEKVETEDDYQAALRDGCELFQGYFFARPEVLAAKQVPNGKLTCLRLLNEVQKPDLRFDRIEQIVRMDVGLTQRLLCFVNSALFGWIKRIESIQQALMCLGEVNVRSWVSLAALPSLAAGRPGELVTISLVRARLAEMAAEQAGIPERAGSCFLAGLLSLLDAMVGRPLEEVIEEMGLDTRVAGIILNSPGASRKERLVFELALAFEEGDSARIEEIALAIGVPVEATSEWYASAVSWADHLLR